MGHPMHHDGGHGHGGGMPPMFAIPIPMAMFGMLTAFMFGANVGMMMGRKHPMMEGHGGGPDPMAWKHKMARLKAMKNHHHHGDGSACMCHERGGEPAEREAEEKAGE